MSPIHSELVRRSRRLLIPILATVGAAAALAGCSASGTSTSAASSSVTSSASGRPSGAAHGFPGGGEGGGSNARSGPAAGGSSGTVSSVSSTGFTFTTQTGQKVTVKDASSTTFQRGSAVATSGSVAAGESVLVLGATQSTTITAVQVTVDPTNIGSKTSGQAGVVAFKQGSPSASKTVGNPPTDYTEGDGTILSGQTAYQATTAAITAYPGIVVDRVVKLADGDYEVHCIGVNWPHHIFLNTALTVIGAD